MSLENRLEEFPQFAETIDENGVSTTPPVLPRPAQVSGTFSVKLLGVEGLLDIRVLRSFSSYELPYTPPRSNSSGTILSSARNFMTLPTPSHRDREKEKEREREREKERERERERDRDKDEDLSSSYTPTSSTTLHWPRRAGSKHVKQKGGVLQKQHSLDDIADGSLGKGGTYG